MKQNGSLIFMYNQGMQKFSLKDFEESLKSKNIDALMFIMRDAHDAAIAMRNMDPIAECKYLDQVNAASTEIYRRTNGKRS